MKNKKSRNDLQSVLTTAGKLSCRRTALKRCNIEILWYRKLVTLASPEFRDILLPRSLLLLLLLLDDFTMISWTYYQNNQHEYLNAVICEWIKDKTEVVE